MSLAVLDNMLKEFNPFQAMSDDLTRADFLMSNISKMNQYSQFRDGKFNIPMVTATQSNVRSGKLTPIDEITKGEHGKAYIEGADLTKLWGSITFTEEEIRTYGDAERAFIELFPDKVNELMENMKELVSIRFLLDGSISKVVDGGTDDDPAAGVVKVTRVERLKKGQRLDFYDADEDELVVGYIHAIDINKELITVKDKALDDNTAAAVDFSTEFTDFTNVKLYIYDDANATKATLKSMLLPAANGGDAELHHLNKLEAGPIWQAQHIDCSSLNFSSATILTDFFKKVVQPIKQKGKVQVPGIALPYAAFNALVLKAQESKRFMSSDVEAKIGYDKVTMTGAGGKVELYGVYDLLEEGFAIDWKNLLLVAPEMFTTKREKGHQQWFMERTENGYVYVLDVLFQGTLGIKKASGFAVLSGISA